MQKVIDKILKIDYNLPVPTRESQPTINQHTIMNDLYYDTVIHQVAYRNGFDVVDKNENKGKNYRRLSSVAHYGVLHADKDGDLFVIYNDNMQVIGRVVYDNENGSHFKELAAVLNKAADWFLAHKL